MTDEQRIRLLRLNELSDDQRVIIKTVTWPENAVIPVSNSRHELIGTATDIRIEDDGWVTAVAHIEDATDLTGLASSAYVDQMEGSGEVIETARLREVWLGTSPIWPGMEIS